MSVNYVTTPEYKNKLKKAELIERVTWLENRANVLEKEKEELQKKKTEDYFNERSEVRLRVLNAIGQIAESAAKVAIEL